MKKLFILSICAILSLVAKAVDNTDVSVYSDLIYAEAVTNLQVGSKGLVKIYSNTSQDVKGFQFDVHLPAGIKITESNTDGVDIDASYSAAGTIKTILVTSMVNARVSAGNGIHIANLEVEVAGDVELGEYPIEITYSKQSAYDGVSKDLSETITSTLVVQRAAPIVAQPSDVIFDVTPVTLATGTQALAIKMKNTYDVANFKIVATYPEGIAPKTGRGVSVTTVTDKLYSSTDNSVTPLSVTQAVSGQVATYTVNNLALDTYVASDNYHNVCIVPVNVTANNSVLNVKFEVSDVKAYDAENDPNLTSPLDVASGSFMTSIFVGTPTESDPIVYGNYESEGARSALQTITGARTVDMTQTTGMTAESAATSLEGVYVQGATQSALMPKSQGTYRTVCVPFAVSGTGRYVISAVDANSITLSPALETIPANTPFVATAGVVVGNESVYPQPTLTPETNAGGLIFKGLYQKTTINGGGNIYYIAQDKFWRADSDVTVAPFKAILTGSLAAKSLKIFIEDETGIREVTNQFDNEDIYNLQGMKLNKTQKGINIVGGKKVILK